MNTTSQYIIQLADNALILGQRLSEWCGHGPVLEQDIAITNITLDLIHAVCFSMLHNCCNLTKTSSRFCAWNTSTKTCCW